MCSCFRSKLFLRAGGFALALATIVDVSGCDRRMVALSQTTAPDLAVTPPPVVLPPQDPNAPLVPTPPGPTLAISNLSVSGLFPSYHPVFTLTETGGQHDAWIDDLIFTFGDDVPQVLGSGCLLTDAAKHVPAGGTWTSSLVYVYCTDLDVSPDKPAPADMLLQVIYESASGTRAFASASVPLQR